MIMSLDLIADLNALQYGVHQDNRERGFYDDVDPKDVRHSASFVALMHSELSELLEALRGDPGAPCGKEFPDGRKLELTAEAEECADLAIRLLDYCEHRGVALAHAIGLKLQYNRTRGHRHGGKAC